MLSRILACVLLAAAAAGALTGSQDSSRATADYQTTALITYYLLEGPMASGNWTYPGAAACTDDIPRWSTVVVMGEAFTCEDAFAPGYQQAPPTRIDVWDRPDFIGCEGGCPIEVIP